MRFIEVTIRTGSLLERRFVNLEYVMYFQQFGTGTRIVLQDSELCDVEESIDLVKSLVFSHIPI